MEEQRLQVLFGIFLICGLLAFVFFPRAHKLSEYAYGSMVPPRGGTMLFVGDIMLGRHVETLSEAYGDTYPFAASVAILENADVTVGNFEAAVPREHVQTPDFNLKFSVPERALGTLANTGFDVLSLANNHAYDFGKEGYLHTQMACKEHAMRCVGHPYEVDDVSSEIVFVDGISVGIVAIHAVNRIPDYDHIFTQVKKLTDQSAHQIAYIHWGVEYKKIHNRAQQYLAYFLIEHGIDAIIGHHPHVVQDIEVYEGKPIFYSLGNFVFDQYFSADVQNGLGVQVFVSEKSLEYNLVPFTSRDTQSQPRLMSVSEKEDFILNIPGNESLELLQRQ